jgi:hypothetical protein
MKSHSLSKKFMLEFVIQRDAIRKKKLTELTPRDERLLDIVALAYVQKERLSVKDLMSKSELGSPAVIHLRMKSLVADKLIELQDTEDIRRYQVAPTERLLSYFDALGKTIDALTIQHR